MTGEKRQSFFRRAYSSLFLPLRRWRANARRRAYLLQAKSDMYVYLKKCGNGSQPTLAEEYHFLGCCASLYEIYGFVPAGYVKESAMSIEAARLTKNKVFNPNIHLKEVH